MPDVTSVMGQDVAFDDFSALRVPYQLTLSEHDAQYHLSVDSSGRFLWLPKPLSRIRLAIAINTLMLGAWIAKGKVGSKPDMVQ